MPDIYFPNLHLSFQFDPIAFSIAGLPIYWYGIILTTGMIVGTFLSSQIAKKQGIDPNTIIDFVMYDLIFAIIGARLYYVCFNWDYYKQHWIEIFNIRQGGIAIYGAIIASVIVAFIYTRIKKIPFFQFADIAVFGLTIGQVIGRYGNFVNREAFGDYTNSLFAMRIIKNQAKLPLSEEILNNTIIENGLEYIQVHPTFFYESCWNILLLCFLFIYKRYQKKEGELFFVYLIGYGIGRFWVEGLRTDQLLIGGSSVAISQVVAIFSIIMGIIGIYKCRNDYKN